MKNYRFLHLLVALLLSLSGVSAQTYYVICNNYSYTGGSTTSYTVGPERVRSYTDMALPGSVAPKYSTQTWSLPGYYRLGEWVDRNGNRAPWSHNRREDMQTPPDVCGGHSRDSVIICVGMNCEYFLVENLGSGTQGPLTTAQQAAQFNKISQAMVKMDADIYGMCEIEQGQEVLRKCAQYLTQQLGRKFSYINDGLTANGTYTKTGYIYCSDRVKPYGDLKKNNTAVANRKLMQCFEVVSGRPNAGERFIFSMNHFKAKSGSGSGDDANKGDGQSTYNGTRVREAASVISLYHNYADATGEPDMLVMGDLNAYAKEDPIREFTNNGYTDLHRYFHADSSYSYVFRGEAGYLDHALVNRYLLKQVVGMDAYHVNSDECDNYTYNGRLYDGTMFRYSDHDPVLVGLLLNREQSTLDALPAVPDPEIRQTDNTVFLENIDSCMVQVFDANGYLVHQNKQLDNSFYQIDFNSMPRGLYIINIYKKDKKLHQEKILKK